jgi:hypothetical protein
VGGEGENREGWRYRGQGQEVSVVFREIIACEGYAVSESGVSPDLQPKASSDWEGSELWK